MNLFDFFAVLTVQNEDYNLVSDKDKKNFSFMLNRYMSAEYPDHAHEFNKCAVDGVTVCDYWREVMIKKRFNRVPNWFFLKASSKHKTSETSFDKADLVEFCIFYKIQIRDLLETLQLKNSKEMEDNIKEFKKWKRTQTL